MRTYLHSSAKRTAGGYLVVLIVQCADLLCSSLVFACGLLSAVEMAANLLMPGSFYSTSDLTEKDMRFVFCAAAVRLPQLTRLSVTLLHR